MPALYQYLITLHGETIDACYSIPDAFDMCDDYAADVWAGRLPDLLTADDFASPAECRAAFGVVACYDDGSTVPVA